LADVNIQLAGQNSVPFRPPARETGRDREREREWCHLQKREGDIVGRGRAAAAAAADASTIRRERRNALILMVLQKESSPLVGGRTRGSRNGGEGKKEQRVTVATRSLARQARPLIELFPKDEIAIVPQPSASTNDGSLRATKIRAIQGFDTPAAIIRATVAKWRESPLLPGASVMMQPFLIGFRLDSLMRDFAFRTYNASMIP